MLFCKLQAINNASCRERGIEGLIVFVRWAPFVGELVRKDPGGTGKVGDTHLSHFGVTSVIRNMAEHGGFDSVRGQAISATFQIP